MKTYNGFRVNCDCHCAKCGHVVVLEGYSDAWGNHYCRNCDDYVPTVSRSCNARTEEKVKAREQMIIKAGALDD